MGVCMCVHACIHLCICISVCMHVCVYVCDVPVFCIQSIMFTMLSGCVDVHIICYYIICTTTSVVNLMRFMFQFMCLSVFFSCLSHSISTL